jgi:hypothetical protein
MIKDSLNTLLVDAAVNPRASWAIVRNGVVAEYSVVRTDDTPKCIIEGKELFVDTARASLRLTLDDSIIPIVAETAAYRCSPWTQNIYLCIPKNMARMSNRRKLTHIGNCGKSGELWDLGVGNDTIDACIIVEDIQLHHQLKQKEGQYIIDDSRLLQRIVESSPVRAFRTKFAEIRVKQKIPVGKEQVEGPHTHLIPVIIQKGIDYPAPIAANLSSVIQVDPFGSVIDGAGDYHDWQGFEFDKFQSLLSTHGKAEYLGEKINMKNRIILLIENNKGEAVVDTYQSFDNVLQDLMRVTLAQIVCDRYLSEHIRKEAMNILKELNAVNYNALKQWSNKMSPSLG